MATLTTLPDSFVEDMKSGIRAIRGGMEENKDSIKGLQEENQRLRSDLDNLRKAQLAAHGHHVKRANDAVSEDCAAFVAALWVKSAQAQGKLRNHKYEQAFLEKANAIIPQTKSLSDTDIPLPVAYGSQIAELVYTYGAARQFMTHYPLGTGIVKLPKLKTSPAFGFMDRGAVVPEKVPQLDITTFTAQKAGGIIRFPMEIEVDSFLALGQFVTRYAAREFAKWEDTVAFGGDGTATYGSISGVCKYALTLGAKVQLAATKTAPTDVTIADLRALRPKVDAGALFNSAYYMHPSWEAFLHSLNGLTGKVYAPYVPMGLKGPTFEGFPVRWVGTMPIYSETAAPSALPIAFGDLSFWFFGECGIPRIDESRDVYFTTDEVAIRALERFDVKSMADACASTLQLADA